MIAFWLQLMSILSGAGLPAFQWVLSHWSNVMKAYADWRAGADLQTILNDLLAQAKVWASQHRAAAAPAFAECCDTSCSYIGQALVDMHSGDADALEKALTDLVLAICTMAQAGP
jgi:hypothetical protein